MSDIVRSRTFEPFIPILSTALVYYIFSFIISNILSVALFKVDRVKKAIK
jgi:ABC-type amino acid transport system permease subunit